MTYSVLRPVPHQPTRASPIASTLVRDLGGGDGYASVPSDTRGVSKVERRGCAEFVDYGAFGGRCGKRNGLPPR